MTDELIQVQPGLGLEGQPANRPGAGVYPYGKQPGNLWLPSDGSTVELLKPDGLGGFTWVALTGGGGVASVVAGDAIRVTGPAANPVVSVFVVGQAAEDLLYFNGVNWTRKPKGNDGDVLTVVGGVLTWAPPAGGGGVASVAATANQGIAIAGTPTNPTVGISLPGQVSGDIPYRNTLGQWVALPAGPDGEVPTADTLGPDRVVFYRAFSAQEPIVYSYSGGHAFSYGYAAQAQGDLSYAAGAFPAGWVRLPLGLLYDRLTVQSGTPAWVAPGAEENWDLYVAGVTGNDANDGRTAGTAVKTLNRAMQLVPDVVKGNVLLHCAAEPITETALWNWMLPAGKANAARAIAIDAPLTEVIAAAPIGGGSQGLLSGFGFVTVVGPLVSGAHAGQLLEYQTAGPNAGIYRIADNGVNSITICGSFPAGPVAGDVVRIVTEGVVVTLVVPGPNDFNYIQGGQLLFSGVEIQQGGGVLVFSQTQCLLNCASFRDATGVVICTRNAAINGGSGFSKPLPAGLAATAQPNCGPDWHPTTQAILNSGFFVSHYKQRQAVLCTQNSCAQISDADFVEAASFGFQYNSSGTVGSVRCLLNAATGPGVIYAQFNSSIQCSYVDFGRVGIVPTQDALLVSHNSVCYAAGLTCSAGPIAGNYGVYCYNGSRCEVPDANVGSTVTGAVGDVQVGGNAAPSTWAQIAGFTAAFCQDLLAGFPTQATVIP